MSEAGKYFGDTD